MAARIFKSKYGWSEIPVGEVKFIPGQRTSIGPSGEDCTSAYGSCSHFMNNHPEYAFQRNNAVVDGVRGLNVRRTK